jgi:hypothetical protein
MRDRRLQQVFQQRLAFVNVLANVDAIDVQQVEQDIPRPPCFLTRQGRLQQVEIRLRAAPRDQFAVERGAFHAVVRARAANSGHLRRPLDA